MRCLVVVLAVIGPAVLAAAEPEDGFYKFTEHGPGTAVERLDGARIVLGERLTDQFGEATIVSVTNDNTQFRLQLPAAGPFPKGADVGPFAMVIAGRTIGRWSHSDLAADGTMSVTGMIDGRDNAAAIAKLLGTKVTLRMHPGHRMQVSLRPEKSAYAPGEPIMLVLRIENVGKRTFSFLDGGQQRGARNNQFGFTAFSNHGFGKALPDVGDPMNFGGKASFQNLEPGDVFEKTVELDKWFRLEEPDGYRVTALYEMLLEEGAGWDDFAVGRCFVTVEKRAAGGE